ncbi:hypothetical protein ACLBKU_03660 [Erythrobacter sp. NE805]|uniref:hypothetical protein n=1 Tax=Erythrobacter sp. NE805 TaxID=3389875 RepID=UPI00396B2D46
MSGKQRPFVVYVGGAIAYRIAPRGLRGWLHLLVWLALLVPAILWLDEHLDSPLTRSEYAAGLLLFAVGVVAWLIGGIWWMLAHGEIVQVVEIKRKRQYERLRRARERERGEERGG